MISNMKNQLYQAIKDISAIKEPFRLVLLEKYGDETMKETANQILRETDAEIFDIASVLLAIQQLQLKLESNCLNRLSPVNWYRRRQICKRAKEAYASAQNFLFGEEAVCRRQSFLLAKQRQNNQKIAADVAQFLAKLLDSIDEETVQDDGNKATAVDRVAEPEACSIISCVPSARPSVGTVYWEGLEEECANQDCGCYEIASQNSDHNKSK